MIVISKNIEGREYHYKDWYKKMATLVGKELETNSDFENSVSIGQKILIEEEDPSLPSGITIPCGIRTIHITLCLTLKNYTTDNQRTEK